MGGIQYFNRLLFSLKAYSDLIEPVVFTGKKSDISFIPPEMDIEVVQSLYFDITPRIPKIHKRIISLLSHDPILDKILTHYRIDIISHIMPNQWPYACLSHIPTIGWIPDLQHKYLPQFFTPSEIQDRDSTYLQLLSGTNFSISSSQSAKNDVLSFYGIKASKIGVLSFYAFYDPYLSIPTTQELYQKYSFTGDYFFIPNQFWQHKNHLVVIEACIKIREMGHSCVIICTGDTTDYRNSNFYSQLQNTISTHRLETSFLVVGKIPYNDLIGFMLGSIAVINPSFFEGWSTTVEEAKFWNIPLILSDIPVHREQNPNDVMYFHPNDSKALAEILIQKWTKNNAISILMNKPGYDTFYINKKNLTNGTALSKTFENIISKTIFSYKTP